MLVHRCDRCCVYKKEIQSCRTKYRGIWAILMHKMVFPFESCKFRFKGYMPSVFRYRGKSLALLIARDGYRLVFIRYRYITDTFKTIPVPKRCRNRYFYKKFKKNYD